MVLDILIILTHKAFRLSGKTNIFKVRHAVVRAWGRVVMVTIDDITCALAVKSELEVKSEPCDRDPYLGTA